LVNALANLPVFSFLFFFARQERAQTSKMASPLLAKSPVEKQKKAAPKDGL